MKDCYFCSYINGESSGLYLLTELSTEQFIVVLDGHPVTPGHTLVIPRRHVQFMKDLDNLEQRELIAQVVKTKSYLNDADLNAAYKNFATELAGTRGEEYVAKAMEGLRRVELRSPDAFNDGLNDGPAAGQTVPHFHWHIMPRWNGDMEDPRGGIRHMFAGLGNYL